MVKIPSQKTISPKGVSSFKGPSTLSNKMEELNYQSKIARAMSNISKKTTPEFVINFINSTSENYRISSKYPTCESLLLVWPPEKPTSRYAKCEDVAKYLKSNLPQKDYKTLMTVLDKKAQDGLAFKNKAAAKVDEMASQRIADDLKNEEKIEKAFGIAKQAILNFILKGRAEKDLKGVDKILYEKIDKITRIKDFHCKPHESNAYNHPSINAVEICEGFRDKPIASLVYALGHEIGHSIDPCYFNFDSVTQKSIDIKLNQHPAYQSIVCFSEVGGFNKSSRTEIIGYVTKLHQAYPFLDPNLVAAYRYFLLEKEECNGYGGPSNHLGEVISDVYGSVALSEYARKFPPKSDFEKLSFLGITIENSNLCEDLEIQSVKSISEMIEFSKKNGPLLNISHPDTLRRMQNIILQNPAVGRMLGCEPIENSCVQLFLNPENQVWNKVKQLIKPAKVNK